MRSRVAGSFAQGLRSTLKSGNSDLNSPTVAAILLANSIDDACSAAFTPSRLYVSLYCSGFIDSGCWYRIPFACDRLCFGLDLYNDFSEGMVISVIFRV